MSGIVTVQRARMAGFLLTWSLALVASPLGGQDADQASGPLLKADLVHRAYVDERAAYYELSHDCSKEQCHPHFTCTNCGQTHCLTELEIPMAESPHQGFQIQRQQVRLEGLCPLCT